MKLADFFSDNMVLQRDKPVPIWGRGTPGEPITVEFGGQKKTATTDANGHWRVTLDPLPVSLEPRELIAETCRISNVLVGDVWLCAGQSNMQWPVERSANPAAEIAAADYPFLRLLHVPQVAKSEPQTDMDAGWKVCSPATIKSFSAPGYYFGREIWQATGIPLGLILCGWGGTRIEPWLSPAALQAVPAPAEPRAPFDAEVWVRQQGRPDPGNRGVTAGWAALDFADGQWPVMELPRSWQFAGYNFSGVFWFRREVNLPTAGQDYELHLGICDKADTTYFNGTPVGAIGFETKSCWKIPRVYRIPGHLVRAGHNVIATRVYSNFFQGGLTGPAESMQLKAGTTCHTLAGPWRYQIEQNFGFIEATFPQPADTWNLPHILYDCMVTPLVPAALRGILWDQGGSNVPQARRYRQQFPLLIQDWRRTFEQPDLPFYFVQFANFTASQRAPVESGYAEMREAQTFGLREPHTGMVVAIDIGDADDIHYKNKQAVGRRLAGLAFANVYGRPGLSHGPQYRSHRVEDHAIRIEFDHAAVLKTSDGAPVKGFAIASRDKKFEWAEAHIDGESIIVHSNRVREPVAVRYAWANNPSVNLYNAADLPAAPFRTDMD